MLIEKENYLLNQQTLSLWRYDKTKIEQKQYSKVS